jgi:NADPH-dependent curcumin reductase CurA
LGINASDINFTSGKYTKVAPPFDAGFEAIGRVVRIGESVTRFKVGDFALLSQYGSFAEFIKVRENIARQIPSVNPEILPLAVSGLTASMALEKIGEMKPNGGETVLVTAAAGGTGQFAVQLAKIAGNHVIGTCSSDDKVEFLKKLGCNRVINYKKEDLNTVLRKEYPSGIDIVYESVGGDIFEVCVNNLAVHGRLIIIGMVSGYASGTAWKGGQEGRPLPARLIGKSASVRGFFLNNFPREQGKHLGVLLKLYKEGKLKSHTDPTHFKGLEQVADAIEFLYKGKNVGKIVVDVSPSEGEIATSIPRSKL